VKRAAEERGWTQGRSLRAMIEDIWSRQVLAGPDETARLHTAVANVDEEVIAKLASPDSSVEETARVLRTLLGDKATAVGQALADQG
jgi:hypothetical protein